MSTLSLFVQEHGQAGIREVVIDEIISGRALHAAFIAAGVTVTADSFIFLDEIDLPLDREDEQYVKGLHHGHRVHVSRCRQIKVKVNYLEHQAHREFGPARRVRSVKAWAAEHFGLDHKDAVEHVLQLCDSTECPTSDTPLHTLLRDKQCALCFNLVPEKRVEG